MNLILIRRAGWLYLMAQSRILIVDDEIKVCQLFSRFLTNQEFLVQTASDGEKALWYSLSAEQKNAKAQFNLGTMYDQGKGVPHNGMRAFKWYSLSADRGYAKAQFNLGEMYREGDITTQDFKRAVKWYRLAGEQ